MDFGVLHKNTQSEEFLWLRYVRTLASVSLGNLCLLPDLVWFPLVRHVSLPVLSVTLSQQGALGLFQLVQFGRMHALIFQETLIWTFGLIQESQLLEDTLSCVLF